jgi:hypothetical protein
MLKLIWSNLWGTLARLFRIRNVALVDDSGVVAARDKDDSADAPVSASVARLKGSTSGQVDLQAPAAPASYALTMPPAQGADGEVLKNDGAGALQWGAETDILERIVTGAGSGESDVNVVVDSESGDVVWI